VARAEPNTCYDELQKPPDPGDRPLRTKNAPMTAIAPIAVTGIVHDRRPESADWHAATKSVCGTIWLRIGMLATDLLFASRALDRFEIAAFPHPRLPPFPSETETGTNNPMIPTTSTTAPTTRTNRRNVTPRPFARCQSSQSCLSASIRKTYDACSLRGSGYARIQLSHRREPGWAIRVGLLTAPHIHPADSVSPALACQAGRTWRCFKSDVRP
jgi:hypothetical protein